MADDVVLKVGAETSGLDAALRSAKSGVESFASASSGSLSGLTSSLSGVSGGFTGLGAVIGIATAALGGVVAAIEKFGSRAAEISTMAETIGVTTAQFQAMSAVADANSVSMDKVSRVVEKLSVLLNDARNNSGPAIEKLHELGITNEQIASSQFTVNDMLGQFRGQLADASTHQDTYNALLKEFGVRGAQAIVVIEHYDGSLKGVAATMAQVSGLTDEEIAKLKEAKAAWAELWTEIVNGASRALIKLKEYYDYAAAAMVRGGKQKDTTTSGFIERPAASAPGGGDAASAAQLAASHNLTLELLKDEQEQIKTTEQGTAARLALVRKFAADSLQYYGSAKVAEVRAANVELFNEEQAYQAKRIQAEREATAVIKHSSALAAADARRALEDSKQMLDVLVLDAQGAARAMEEAQVGGINRQIEAVHASASAYRISLAQELSDTKALLAAEWADEQAYYAKLRALDVAAGTSTRTADDALEAAHQRYLRNLQKADENYGAQTAARWRQFSSVIESSFAGAISGMIQGTQTFAGAMRSIMGSVIDALVNMFVKMAASWVEQKFIEMAATRTAAAANVTASAGMAGAAGTASFAEAPWPIDIGAPGFGASMAFIAGSYAVAARGFDIPRGINPLTQLHGGEMVLPAHLADTVRAGARGGGGGEVHHHWNINAWDSGSVKSWLSNPANRGMLMNAVHTHYSRGGRVG